MSIINFLWVIVSLYVKDQVVFPYIKLFSVIGGIIYLERL